MFGLAVINVAVIENLIDRSKNLELISLSINRLVFQLKCVP